MVIPVTVNHNISVRPISYIKYFVCHQRLTKHIIVLCQRKNRNTSCCWTWCHLCIRIITWWQRWFYQISPSNVKLSSSTCLSVSRGGVCRHRRSRVCAAKCLQCVSSRTEYVQVQPSRKFPFWPTRHMARMAGTVWPISSRYKIAQWGRWGASQFSHICHG